MTSITRRSFLKASSATALGLSLGRLSVGAKPAGAAAAAEAAPEAYGGWEDVYRNQWRWDRIAHSSHECNCNNSCSWTVYVRDGIAWREEQTARYVQSIPDLPDFNPMGCQKGASFTHQMYTTGRVLHPLQRVGERGSGQWKRVSWDEALTGVATKLIEIIRDDGHDTITMFTGTQAGGANEGGPGKVRFNDLIGGVMIEPWGEIGDAHNGAIISTGHECFDGGSDTRLLSKCIILWVYNPVATRIPDAHHLTEARYAGAQIISISPDVNPTHMHADLWVNPKPGTDTAIAMAMASVIVRDKLYDTEHIKEQTDLPFLVRDDTRKFLRESDVRSAGSDEVFFVWDSRTGAPVAAPGAMGSETRSLVLGDVDPVLEGEWDVRLHDGQSVRVRTVFEHLKAVLAEHTPEFAAGVTGVAASTIERIARDYATAKPALIQVGWGVNKLYHADLLERCVVLLSALTGNTGKVGGGFWTGGILPADGTATFVPIARQTLRHRTISGTPWLYVHGGLREVESRWVPTPGERSGDDYIMEAIEKRWMPVYPEPGRDPAALIECGSNLLRRTRMNHIVREYLWPKLKLVVGIDFRMNSTALQADWVLPAAAYYETDGIRYADTKIPYHSFKGKAVEPVGESASEWTIFALLSKKIAELAPRMGFTAYRDEMRGVDRDLSKLYDEFTENGRWPEDVDGRVILRQIMENSRCYRGVSLEELDANGIVPWTGVGTKSDPVLGQTGDYELGKPYTAATDFVVEKQPWPTLTGRQQFYIDHDWFLEFGEELPVHRDPPNQGGEHPLRLTCGHARWSIHSLWRDNPLLLRLQRGEPILYVSPKDAAARDIADGERVELFNDVGSCQIMVKLTPAMQPGQVHVYHAWETFQFQGGRTHASVSASQVKPLNMVGNYGHLYYSPGYYQPNNTDKGTTVDIRKV